MFFFINIGNTNCIFNLKSKEINIKKTLCLKGLCKKNIKKKVITFLKINKIHLNEIEEVVICAVENNLQCKFLKIFKELQKNVFLINNNLISDINLSYYDKKALGTDRFVIAQGAFKIYKPPFIIIDFGTATTINVIDKNANFLGGLILCGIFMSLNSLNKNTSKLPLVSNLNDVKLIGNNTNSCIASGIIFGNCAVIENIVEKIKIQEKNDFKVIITGGSAKYLKNYLNIKAIYDNELILKGMHDIYFINKKIKMVNK